MDNRELRQLWQGIDQVLLDMDGTLLDRHFDDYFWEHFVPENYALAHDMSVHDARKLLIQKFRKHEGTLQWADLDFWSHKLGLDIPALKIKIDHLIAVHPYVTDFIVFCKSLNKKVIMVTNAHSKTLAIKMEKTTLKGYFDELICSQQIGVAKEDPVFWEMLHAHIDYDPERTLLADDTEAVLVSAERYGIKNLIYVAKPSSRSGPVKSEKFKSITYFDELIIGGDV